MTCWLFSSTPSSASSAEGFAPMSSRELLSNAILPVIFARHTDVLGTQSDLLAVGLVSDTVNFLNVVRIGENLVSGDNVLRQCQEIRNHATSESPDLVDNHVCDGVVWTRRLRG